MDLSNLPCVGHFTALAQPAWQQPGGLTTSAGNSILPPYCCRRTVPCTCCWRDFGCLTTVLYGGYSYKPAAVAAIGKDLPLATCTLSPWNAACQQQRCHDPCTRIPMYAQEPRQQPQQQQQNAADPEALLRLLIAPGEEDAVASLEWARLHVPSDPPRNAPSAVGNGLLRAVEFIDGGGLEQAILAAGHEVNGGADALGSMPVTCKRSISPVSIFHGGLGCPCMRCTCCWAGMTSVPLTCMCRSSSMMSGALQQTAVMMRCTAATAATAAITL